MINKREVFAIFLSVLTTVSCADGVKATRKAGSTIHQDTAGSLTDRVKGLLDKKYYSDPCDQTLHSKKLQIATILDRKEAEISATAKSLPDTSSFKRVKLGSLTIKEQIIPPNPKGENEYSQNWDEIFSLYEKIKSIPVDKNWVSLNRSFRGILVSDENRIAGSNVYLEKSSGPQLKAAIEDMNNALTCFTNGKCSTPTYNSTTSAFLDSNPIYAKLKKTGAFHGILQRLESDEYRYKLYKNQSVHRSSDGTQIIVPLSMDGEGVDQAKFAEYIESVWRGAGISVKMDFSPQYGYGIFSLDVLDVIGGRSYVVPDSFKMVLYSDIESRGIAHEIGHVLGLPDTYFEVWQPETCSYKVQADDRDLMADHIDGSVTDEAWDILKSNYP